MHRGNLNYNGKLYHSDKLLISVDNRSFRYGDGFFETMKMLNGKIILADYHFERLFQTLDAMHFEKPAWYTPAYFEEQVLNLAKQNGHEQLARIRLTIFRGDGGLYDTENNFPNFIIQTWEINKALNSFNENGLVLDIFPDARKACDLFSGIKSNNYLPYAMAAFWAKKNKLNDALILNSNERIAEATIANVFIVKDGLIKTPALSEGCVSGITRKYLLKCLQDENIPVQETQLNVDDVLSASEVFLTNAAYHIKWVSSVGVSNYKQQLSSYLYAKFILPLLTGE